MAEKAESMRRELGLRESLAVVRSLVALSSPHGDDTRGAQAITALALPGWAEPVHSVHGAASQAQAQGRSPGPGCPGRLWSLLLWRYSGPAWTRCCAACSG